VFVTFLSWSVLYQNGGFEKSRLSKFSISLKTFFLLLLVLTFLDAPDFSIFFI